MTARRHIRLVGGPEIPREDVILTLPAAGGEPLFTCRRNGKGPWLHYERTTPGLYRYAGLCETVNHRHHDEHLREES